MTESKDLTPTDPRIAGALAKYSLDVKIGDLFMDNYGSLGQIVRFNCHERDNMDPLIRVALRYLDSTHERLIDLEELHFPNWIKVTVSPEQLDELVIEAMRDPSRLDPYAAQVNTNEMSLVRTETGNRVTDMLAETQRRMTQVEMISRRIEMKQQAIRSIVWRMKDQIKYLEKVLDALMLYTGLNEKVTLLRDGAPAPIETPITFRQLILYMDEEVGDPRIQLDFEEIEHFDKWLLSDPANLDKVLPETKGLVAIRPSRQKWFYSNHPWARARQDEDRRVYLLCRNGEKVYRIWTGTKAFESKLFPGPDEIQRVFDDTNRYISDYRREETMFGWKRQILLLQGILDRTDIFLPMSHFVLLTDPNTYQGLIQIIYDAEPSLTEGRARYKDWKSAVNAGIKRGSRVIIGRVEKRGVWSYTARFTLDFVHDYNCPPPPKAGVYTIEDVQELRVSYTEDNPKVYYVIRYNPKDTVYGPWGEYDPHPRKNRVGFRLRASDSFVLNYDGISLEDVEYYIGDRLERQGYLDMLPVLYEIRDRRLAEIGHEQHFVNLVAGRLECDPAIVWAAVEWWKTKVIWKRTIAEDDAKAMRMIEKRVTRQLKGGK